MTLKAKFECDENGCFNEVDIAVYEPYDNESLPDDWSHDETNDFHYCPNCIKKMIKSGEL